MNKPSYREPVRKIRESGEKSARAAHADADLETREARFRGLFDRMRSGVAIYSPKQDGRDFIFVDINRAAEEIGGFRKQDVIGRSVFDIFPAVEDSGLLNVFRRVWRNGEAERHSTYKYDGVRLVRWWDNYVDRLPSGEIIVIHDDITERKNAEDRIFAYQEQLQSLTAELSLAEERERRRIARDLHDQIGQLLSVIKMKMFSLRESLNTENTIKELDEARELLDKAIKETRSLTFELSPPVLYELGLEAALEWLLENFQAQHKIESHMVRDKEPKHLDDDVSIILFRAARELVINIAKHARASKVRVSVHRVDGRIQIMVEDDGIGFDFQKKSTQITKSLGFGLFNIRERLERLGGSLAIESKTGKGTRAVIVAPLKEEEG